MLMMMPIVIPSDILCVRSRCDGQPDSANALGCFEFRLVYTKIIALRNRLVELNFATEVKTNREITCSSADLRLLLFQCVELDQNKKCDSNPGSRGLEVSCAFNRRKNFRAPTSPFKDRDQEPDPNISLYSVSGSLSCLGRVTI